MENLVNMSKFSKLCDTKPSTLRYWHEVGVLVPDVYNEGDKSANARLYDRERVKEIYAIKVLSKLGLSLNSIKKHLMYYSNSGLSSTLFRLGSIEYENIQRSFNKLINITLVMKFLDRINPDYVKVEDLDDDELDAIMPSFDYINDDLLDMELCDWNPDVWYNNPCYPDIYDNYRNFLRNIDD